MGAAAIRTELRDGRSPSLKRRRRIGGLAALGLVDFGVISLYQMGAVRKLPDLKWKVFDSNKVNASEKAYELGLPDGTTGAAMYALLLMLASAGGSKKTGRSPVLDVALGATVVAGGGAALQYLWNMARKQERACLYCIGGAALNFAMLPLAFPDAVSGVRSRLSGARARVEAR